MKTLLALLLTCSLSLSYAQPYPDLGRFGVIAKFDVSNPKNNPVGDFWRITKPRLEGFQHLTVINSAGTKTGFIELLADENPTRYDIDLSGTADSVEVTFQTSAPRVAIYDLRFYDSNYQPVSGYSYRRVATGGSFWIYPPLRDDGVKSFSVKLVATRRW